MSDKHFQQFFNQIMKEKENEFGQSVLKVIIKKFYTHNSHIFISCPNNLFLHITVFSVKILRL